MRLTVGPLPAAVYWRRRAGVLGGILLLVVFVSYACSGGGTTAGTSPAAGIESTTAAPMGTASPTGTADAVPTSDMSPSPSPSVTVDPSICTDDEIKVTAKPERTTLPRGATLVITLLIKNVSDRTCSRDVGPDLQELRIVLGTEKVWSSDDCNGPRGHDVLQFPPHFERSYSAVWNGKASTACTKQMRSMPDGPIPPRGDYTVLGRVGTDLSKGVTLTLT